MKKNEEESVPFDINSARIRLQAAVVWKDCQGALTASALSARARLGVAGVPFLVGFERREQ